MTTRILPPEEWARLAETELAGVVPSLPPSSASILVVEDHGVIVATWALITMVHAEGLWIAPSHRRRFGVGARLLRGMRQMAHSLGCHAVQTASVSPEVTDFITRLGGSPLPGQMFLLPMEAACQEPY